MNIIKENAFGIDSIINIFQNVLYTELSEIWSLTELDSLFTGRCYKNNTDLGLIPELYTSNGEYSELLLDDKLKAQIFFIVSDKSTVSNETRTSNVDIIFLTNASLIYPNSREDERIKNDVLNLCTPNYCNFTLTGIVTGIENVFKEFTGWKSKNESYVDMHPYHCFRLSFTTTYKISKCY